MIKPNITHGDFRIWSMTVLYEQIEKVINAKQHRRKPYYILARLERGYAGPPVKNANNLLSDDKVTAEKTKNVNFENKIVLSSRLILMETPPIVPMINTMLWKVDSVRGSIDPVYVLPIDAPVESTKEMTEESELVGKSGENMPLVHNKRK